MGCEYVFRLSVHPSSVCVYIFGNGAFVDKDELINFEVKSSRQECCEELFSFIMT